MKKLGEMFRRMLVGRYGVDHLGRDMMWLSIIFVLLYTFTRLRVLWYVGLVVMALMYGRMFSKRISQRYEENRKYMIWREPIARKVVRFLKRIEDLPKYKYLRCPNCKKEMRVPRGKKNIVVTCPSCRNKFDAKS